MLYTETRPKQPTLVSDNPSTTSTKPNTVATPPKMDFSLYPTCKFKIQCHTINREYYFPIVLVTPKVTYTCLLPADSEGTFVTM